MSAQRARLADGRLHLNHGPIDLIIDARGEAIEVERAYGQAWARFPFILPELVAELAVLRRPLLDFQPSLQGQVARRMAEACWPFRQRFITPMAAVAGAVAEEVLAALVDRRRLASAYVNNGGDIALHLAAGERLSVGVVDELGAPTMAGRAEICAEDPVRGIATSGQGGRSFSLGIADAVTVLAARAAEADAAATLIANAVDLDHPAISRQPASTLDPDSDLRDLAVTVAVGPLSEEEIDLALAAGMERAGEFARAGLIVAAMLQLRGQRRIVVGDGYPDTQVSRDRGGNLP